VASPEITKQSAHTLRSGRGECLILLGEMHDLNTVILSSTPTNENHKSQLGDHPDPEPRKTVTFASSRSAGLIQQNSWSRSPHLLCMATPGLQICEPFALTASRHATCFLANRYAPARPASFFERLAGLGPFIRCLYLQMASQGFLRGCFHLFGRGDAWCRR
jgi:hypothetical protein